MSNEYVYPLINGRVMRGTLVDSCGVPAYGDSAYVSTECFVSVVVTPNYFDSAEISVVDASGRRCVHRDAQNELTNLSLSITFGKADPEFYSMVTGAPVIRDTNGDAIGFRTNRTLRPSDVRLALELWMDASENGGCDDGDAVPYGYFLWPFLSGGKVGAYTIENGAVTFTITDMMTKDGSQWGIGPYDVANDDLGAAQALYDGIVDLDHAIHFRTTIAPPAATNGLVPLDNPDNAAATSATAGTPGTWSPTGDVRPADLTALQASSVTGSGGVTPWTTGQYVLLGDGSKAHWAGSGATPKWVAGKA